MFLPAISEWRRARPIPTNAQALAMLEAAGSPPLGSDDVPLADLTMRIQWSTAGYFKPGDRFKAADNDAWWSAPYAGADVLWQHLDDLAARSDRFVTSERLTDQNIIPVLDLELMSGKRDAIAQSLASMWSVMQEWRRTGKEPIPPARPDPQNPKEPPGGWNRWHRGLWCAIRPWERECSVLPGPISESFGKLGSVIMFALVVYALGRATNKRR